MSCFLYYVEPALTDLARPPPEVGRGQVLQGEDAPRLEVEDLEAGRAAVERVRRILYTRDID